jgi:hypothetical protein
VTPRQIERFFKRLSEELGCAATVYLTGAAAGALLGRVRPSLDIDFGLVLRGRSKRNWEDVALAVRRTSSLMGIAASVASDIDRWGMITLLDYRRSSRAMFQLGLLQVRVLAPLHWSIGKLTRFVEPDIADVIDVFKRKRVTFKSAASLWGKALRASPPSTSQFQFRRNVERFFTDHGAQIWGKRFDPAAAIAIFHRAARIDPGASITRSS